MRHIFLSALLISLFSSTALKAQEVSYPEEKLSNFKLIINGIKKAEGEVRIAVFNSKEKYTKEPVFAVVLPVDSTSIVWEQNELPFGDYAIAVYHDKNKNGKLDTNFLGIPKERYGFSNNARGRFGPASWKDSKFSVNENTATEVIRIK